MTWSASALLRALVAIWLAVALSGCVGGAPVEPRDAVGVWVVPEGPPWFAHIIHVGFCGDPPCHGAVVLFGVDQVLWVSWGTDWSEDGDGAPDVRVIPDERYRTTVEAAMSFMEARPDDRVYRVRALTLDPDDSALIVAALHASLDEATDPGRVTYTCTDVGMPDIVAQTDVYWHVAVAPRGDHCGSNEHAQQVWYDLEAQGEALSGWIRPNPWWS